MNPNQDVLDHLVRMLPSELELLIVRLNIPDYALRRDTRAHTAADVLRHCEARDPHVVGLRRRLGVSCQGIYQPRYALQGRVERALENAEALQLIGASGMGKSRVLEWIEREQTRADRRVVFLHADGHEFKSPVYLVQRMAEELGRQREVERELGIGRTPDDATRALKHFHNTTLIVDSADALAQADHSFTGGFFEQLRAMTQARSFQWVSASRHNVAASFRALGLTSRFLNDTTALTVGAFSEDEARDAARTLRFPLEHLPALAAQSGLVPQIVAALLQHEALPTDDELHQRATPLYQRWWDHLPDTRRDLLRRYAQPSPDATFSDDETDALKNLADAGLLQRHPNGTFTLPAPWARFILHAG